MKQRLPAFILFLFLTSSLFGADRYWVGGSGNWNDPSHWSDSKEGKGGSTIPGLNDRVFIETYSPEKEIITIDAVAACGDLRFDFTSDLGGLLNKLEMTGNGEINIGSSLYIGTDFTDHFTGTWKLSDQLACMRDNSLAEITTNGHIFSGQFIFPTLEKNTCINGWSITDKLIVNNTVEVRENDCLYLSEKAQLAGLKFIDPSK